MNDLHNYLVSHAGFQPEDLTTFSCFVQCNKTPFGDASDDILCAMVRYTNPQNKNDWGYDVFVLHDTDQPSLIYWEISCVFSTHHELFEKKPLV